MRCLGIPNTAHFANVTAIEDAMALWEKLKQQVCGSIPFLKGLKYQIHCVLSTNPFLSVQPYFIVFRNMTRHGNQSKRRSLKIRKEMSSTRKYLKISKGRDCCENAINAFHFRSVAFHQKYKEGYSDQRSLDLILSTSHLNR